MLARASALSARRATLRAVNADLSRLDRKLSRLKTALRGLLRGSDRPAQQSDKAYRHRVEPHPLT